MNILYRQMLNQFYGEDSVLHTGVMFHRKKSDLERRRYLYSKESGTHTH